MAKTLKATMSPRIRRGESVRVVFVNCVFDIRDASMLDMLFNHNRKRVALAWKIFSIVIIVSMILLYMPGLFN